MLSTEPLHQGTTTLVQTQLANIFAIQSMQDYLKYLILTTSISGAKTCNRMPETNALDTICFSSPSQTLEHTASCAKSDNNSSDHENEIQHAPSPSSHDFRASHNKSQRLWNLMAKRCSDKKIRLSGKGADAKEIVEEGEIYRNFNGIYMPVIKNQAAKVKRLNTCQHVHREHYARGLCASCYHRVGRDKKPWNCNHENLYALGLCHKCYLVRNRQNKKLQQQQQQKDMKVSYEIAVKQEACADIIIKQEY